MPLQKQPVAINFSGGLDTKTDPYQVHAGKFVSLTNSVFDTLGRLTKRNGFSNITALPNSNTSYLTTFNGDLQALGTNLYAYSPGQMSWTQKGSIHPIRLATQPLIRSATTQSQADSVIASNGLICTVYTDQTPTALSTPRYMYVIADSVTGQNIISPTPIPVSSGTITYAPRIFLLGNYFLIVFGNVIAAVNHLQYVAISTTNPTSVTGNADLSSSYTPSSQLNFDGFVANNRLYVAWNGGGGSGIKMTYLQANLVQGITTNPDASHVATIMSVTADITQTIPIIWASYYDNATTSGYTLAVDSSLNSVLAPQQIITTGLFANITSSAQNSLNTIFAEKNNNYSYDGSIPTNTVFVDTMTQGGSGGTLSPSLRGVGLASKSFLIDGVIYYMAAYQSPYQPTYFLVQGTSTSGIPLPVAKLAYSNGGGYLTTGLPSVYVSGTSAHTTYLFKDLIQAVNKDTNVPSGSQIAGVYSQTGINGVTFNFDTQGIQSSEIANNLALTGGFLWSYDGYLPVEHNFLLWPDSVEITTSTTGGSLADQTYFYQVTYEWTDNQGNAYRSAPSIPVKQVTTGGGTSSNVLHIPTLRLTYKISNPVKIVVYRWSTAQQSYYQVTSISMPSINNTAMDSINITDTLSDAAILGNNLIYTTGGVVEDINAPASSITTLFDDRLWLVAAEDTNLLWYSKQVIEATPVEMSDLFTMYIAPSTGAQGSTGPITALSAMDDKLIIFKQDAIYYVTGAGPDNTGANNQYSQPIFITATVGCSLPRSITMTPNGLMFQSDKGIWLLGRNLSTTYIGAEVEQFNSSTVTSATTIPATNQTRFALSTGEMLMYDYFVGQWGTFKGIPSVSSTLFDGLHTIINQYGTVAQESKGQYLDGAVPVLMQFTTSWLNLAGLQGYQRAYMFYLLGTYLSPHKLQLSIAQDYNPSPSQGVIITPDNFSPAYGNTSPFGTQSPYGGPSNIEQWRIFLTTQKCQALQISMQEVYDASMSVQAGGGLTLSGLNLVVGLKKGYFPQRAARSAS